MIGQDAEKSNADWRSQRYYTGDWRGYLSNTMSELGLQAWSQPNTRIRC